MLCDWLGVDPSEPQANEKLLAAMAREFIPYFRDAELVIGRKVSHEVELGVHLMQRRVRSGKTMRRAADLAAEQVQKVTGRKVSSGTLRNLYREWHMRR